MARAAKGHEVDVRDLNYKAGDAYQDSAQCRSNETVVFIDSTGRTYSVPAHILPSARGLGEPLTGRLSPPDGAKFCGVMSGKPDQLYLLATDLGYGFVACLEDMLTKNKKGKAMMKVPPGAMVLPPVRVTDVETEWVVAATNDGRMLIHHISELPQLPKGKGVKIIGINSAKHAKKEELLAAITIVNEESSIKVYTEKRYVTMDQDAMAPYEGERARRGMKLPRGFRGVEWIEASEE